MAWAVTAMMGVSSEGCVGADLLSHLPAVHLGQTHVQEDQVGFFQQGHLQALLAVHGFDQFVVVLEELDQEIAVHFHVFYDQDFFHESKDIDYPVPSQV